MATAGGSVFFAGVPDTLHFVGFTSAAGVASMTISASGAGALNLDNLQFAAQSTVPEPSPYALLGTGLLTVSGPARRRRRTAA